MSIEGAPCRASAEAPSKYQLKSAAARLARQPGLTRGLRYAYEQYADGASPEDIKWTLRGVDVDYGTFIQSIVEAARHDA